MTLSLSTMWAQQDRYVADMHAFAAEALAMGYDAIEIAHSLTREPFERLLSYPDVPISSIHAPAPLERHRDNVANSALNLASTDDDERFAAIEYAKHTIAHAGKAGARYVVVHLGGVGNTMFDEEREMRRLFDSGTREGARIDELREACYTKRRGMAGEWLEHARQTLVRLTMHAREHDVALGIENRLHYHEIPLPEEAPWLLDGHDPSLVGYWHDVGHAEVQARLGFVDKRRWLDVNGPRTLGAHLHDVTGLADHRAPGNGDVDWTYIAAGLPAEALRVFEINQRQEAADVAAAIGFLRERGVV